MEIVSLFYIIKKVKIGAKLQEKDSRVWYNGIDGITWVVFVPIPVPQDKKSGIVSISRA